MINIDDNAFFHVHTSRCRHATGADREYVERAIELKATEIWFTDHAPYPNDSVGKRMLMSELDEYKRSIRTLGEEYKKDISVKVGLEMEYFPSHEDYIRKTREAGDLDIILLGQHFYEKEDHTFYFARRNEENDDEMYGLAKGIVDGVKTGLFDVVAHPDRIFRRNITWTPEMERLSADILDAVSKTDVILEKNYGSVIRKNHYWNEFWDMVPKDRKIVKGLDAHDVMTLRNLDFEFVPIH